jgi:CRP-like cAMP-binding protein
MERTLCFEQLMNFLHSVHKISEEEEKLLSGLCTLQSLQKNQELQPIGHTCKSIYFVNKGMLRICYLKNGVDITESFEPENSIVARAESLFAGLPSKKAICAVEDTEVVAINVPKLFALFDAHPNLERLFRKVFEKQHVRTIHRLESLQFNTPEERYQQLLDEQPNILLRAPLKHIATYLGITQVSLSRIRARK